MPSTPTPPRKTCTPPSTCWPTSSIAACIKHKEKKADHHAAEARKARAGKRAPSAIPCGSSSSAGCRDPARAWRCTCSKTLGFYCVDNIPAALLKPFISHTLRNNEAQYYARTAVGVDARNAAAEIETVPPLIEELKRSGIHCEILFLLADDEELLRRFAETRRNHPISTRPRVAEAKPSPSSGGCSSPSLNAADLVIDTSRMGVHDLRELISQRVEKRSPARLSLLVESFGFKHGIPGDADFVFDARSLPNPYWDPSLRALTGRDPASSAFSRRSAACRGLSTTSCSS